MADTVDDRAAGEVNEDLVPAIEQLRSLFASVDAGIVVQTTTGAIVEHNAAAERVLGLTGDELRGRTSMDPRWRTIKADGSPFPGQEHPAMLTLSTGKPCFGVLMGVYRKDGELRWISVNSQPLEGGRGVVCAFNDVTELKRRELSLELSESTQRAILQAALDAVISIGSEGHILSINTAGERMFGWNAADLVGKNVDVLMPREEGVSHANQMHARKAGAQGTVIGRSRRIRGLRKDGSVFPVEISVGDALAAGGRIFVGVIRDLTESERAEKESEIFFSLSLDLLAIAGFDGHFKRLNPAWTKTLGWSRAEMLARPFTDFVHPEDLERTNLEVGKLRGEGHVTIDFENRYQHADGHWRVLRWTAAPVPDRGLMICAARDVTDMIATQDALMLAKELAEQTASAKSDFLATMSHEIRTPMNGVLGMLSLLSETDLSPTQLDYVKTATSSGNTLLSLINDILDLSKLESGGLELERRPFDLRSLVDESVASMAVASRDKGLRLRYQIDSLLPRMLMGDSLRIRQVLLNLVGNAVKFTSSGEVLVDVTVVSQTDSKVDVCLSVKDTGIGISPEATDRLFSPFMQADASTTRKFGGTGLGLAICRRLVGSMGGTIDFESTQGQGSVFRVFVQWPVAADAAVSPATPGPFVVSEPLPGYKVLVVEDNLVNQKVLVAMLTKLGVVCEVAINGAKGVEAISQNKFDLVFMDCQMPEMDGYTATRLIREGVPGGKDIPIVALTANVLSGEREICLASGMNGYLSKPVSRNDLLSVLQTLIQHPRSQN